MDIRGKKLLVLAGSDVHCKVVDAARELGVYTIVTDYLQDSPAKKIADESQMFSITDVDSIVDFCKTNAVDGVLNFCNDTAQAPYQKICERLNVPCFCTEEQVQKLSNKRLFKQMCVENGVAVIPEYTEADVEANAIEYPVVVKPVDSRGSRGVQTCNSIEELKKAIEIAKRESKSGEIIIEKSMYGKQDFTMTYFFVDGVPYTIRAGDRYLGKKEYGLDRQCCGLVAPSKYTDWYMRSEDQKIKNMLVNLGLKYGPVFMQGFIDGDVLRVYDPGIRFPGGDYERVFKRIVGVDLMKAMVQFAIAGKMEVDTDALRDGYLLRGNCSVQVVLDSAPGEIAVYSGMDEISRMEGVVYCLQKAFPGETIPNSGDVKQQIGEIGILAPDDAQSLSALVARTIKSITVRSAAGENMLLDQLDYTAIRPV